MRRWSRFIAYSLSAITLVLSASTVVSNADDAEWTTAEEKAEKAFVDGKYEEADVLWKNALSTAEKLGANDLKVAQTINQMTHLFVHEKKYDQAVPLLKRALDIRIKALGENNMLTAENLGNLALIDHKLGDDVEAEKLYQRALEIKEKKLGDRSPSVAITKSNLANLYAEMKNCSEAKALYMDALSIDEKAYGENHEEVANDALNLGILLYNCNHPEDALGYLQRAAKINETTAANNPARVHALHYIGLCQAMLKSPAEAEKSYKQALAVQESIKGKGHPDTIVHILNIAKVADEQGRKDEAEKLYKDSLVALETARPANKYTLTECLLELGHFYHRHNQNDEAENSYKSALQNYETLTRNQQRKLYELPRAYADLLKETKREKESDDMSKKYLDVYQPEPGEVIK
jgi:tetratricopeptide (TPR) repeat protein